MAGMAADDAPETPRPPAPGREAESDDEESSLSTDFLNGGVANDGEQITGVVEPPPPPPVDTYLMYLQRQERELSVNLKGQAARDYARGLSDGGSAAGEENQVSSPWRFVALSELIAPQRSAADQPAVATAVRSEICKFCRRWRAATPRIPFKHVCLCVTCRHNPYARTRCSDCGAGRRRSSADSP